MSKVRLTLPEIKATTFEILKYFKNYCEENDIRFYLSNGTLLGAVKYSGFIPWDDDIDVFVPREDYDRLVKNFQNNKRYRLFSVEREPNYKFAFAKLCNMTTFKSEKNIDNGVQLGIDIDIFPLDQCTTHMLSFVTQKKIQIYQKGCVLSKFVSFGNQPFHKKCIIKYCKRRGFQYFYQKLVAIVKKESIKKCEYKGCLMWPIYGEKEIVPSHVFDDKIEVTFENEKFPAPIGYDIYLRSLYGNYEEDPPIEKQITHHSFEAYQL